MLKTDLAALSPTTRKWVQSVLSGWELDQHHERLLLLAAQAFDESQQARKILKRQGLTCKDRYGVQKAHPATAIERDARLNFVRLLRELQLDVEPPADETRTPRFSMPPALKENKDAAS